MRTIFQARSWLLLVALLMQQTASHAFELIDIPVLIELNPDGSYLFDYANLGVPNTGFTILSRQGDVLNLQGQTSFAPTLGLLEGENLQEGFALYDGTLFLELNALDPNGARAAIRTTYRMDVDPRALGRDHLRSLFLRQGVVRTEARARARARAAGLADARLMRFVTSRDGGGDWARAVRAIRAQGRADIRFMPRTAPDGVLGHYGYDTKTDGSSYVWAVMDRNSKYAVGLTVDRDSDGVANAEDNCVGLANPNQNDQDGDGSGDACDSDDDNDSVPDDLDNCPLAANPGQDDFDGDTIGDACDADDDNDSVNDGLDACLTTDEGAVVDAQGCSLVDHCPCGNNWKNHGGYVRCVTHASQDFVVSGLMTSEEKGTVVSAAGRSACGAKGP